MKPISDFELRSQAYSPYCEEGEPLLSNPSDPLKIDALRKDISLHDTQFEKRDLYFKGKRIATQTCLLGNDLFAQFALRDGYLLMTCVGDPWEDVDLPPRNTVNFYYISKDLAIRDWVSFMCLWYNWNYNDPPRYDAENNLTIPNFSPVERFTFESENKVVMLMRSGSRYRLCVHEPPRRFCPTHLFVFHSGPRFHQPRHLQVNRLYWNQIGGEK